MEQQGELRFVHGQEESMTRQPGYMSLTDILGESPEGGSDTARWDVFSVLDAINSRYDRIPPASRFTPQENAFFQEGDDMSYVHDLLSGRTTLPARAQVAAVPASVKPVGERPRFSFGRRFAQAAANVVVAGAALVASYVSHSYAHHQEQAALADRAAHETRTQVPVYTAIEK